MFEQRAAGLELEVALFLPSASRNQPKFRNEAQREFRNETPEKP
jgi:hypothetical protein